MIIEFKYKVCIELGDCRHDIPMDLDCIRCNQDIVESIPCGNCFGGKLLTGKGLNTCFGCKRERIDGKLIW